MKYTNKQLFNDGLRIKGQVPADDRTVLGAVSELYVSASNRGDDTLFNRAYVGLKVTIEGEDFASYVCVNADPYTPGSTIEVKASNWKTYWHKADKDIFDYVSTSVDTSIRDLSTFVRNTVNTSVNLLETYARTNNIPDANNNGLTITPTLGTTGNSYAIKVNTDSSTVAIVNDKLTGGTYRVVKDNDNDLDDSNLFAKYYLVYRKPGSSSDTEIAGSATIEIPKVQILKDAYLCKAEPDATQPGGYKVTSRQGDASWDTDTNDVFICIEWDIQNGNSDELIGNSDGVTYIGISDIFSKNFEIINTSINYLESSVGDISTKFRAADASIFSGLTTSISNLKTAVNTSLGDLKSYVDGSVSMLLREDSSLKSYVDGSLGTLKSYVDGSVRTLRTEYKNGDSSLKTYVDGSINTIIALIGSSTGNLKDYVDGSIASLRSADASIYSGLSTSITNLQTAVNSSLSSLKSYVDSSLGSMKTYVDGSINSLRTYTDSSITSLKNYTDGSLGSMKTYVDGSIGTVKLSIGELKNYTDGSLNDIRSDVNSSIGDINTVVNACDSSVKEVYQMIITMQTTWAGAWNQLFEANPTLKRVPGGNT